MSMGLALSVLSILIIASGSARAETVTGTWTSTVAGEGAFLDCDISDAYYDVTLTLNSGGSGTWRETCTRVENILPGFEDEVLATVGVTHTYNVQYTVSGSSVTLVMGGGTYDLTVSSGRMTGSGSILYSQTGEVMYWTIDLKGGGLGLSSASAPIAGLAVAAAAIGLGAAILPAPASATPGPLPLRPPEQSIGLPTQRPGVTTGNHMVPRDAPMQELPQYYPADYPYPLGTNAAMRCPYCGQQTLSPYVTGWFCANTQCPARREWITKGQVRHEFNNMSWRGQ